MIKFISKIYLINFENSIMAKNSENVLKIKEMLPPEDKALVYIIRPSIVGRVVELILECNGTYLATTKGKRFLYLLLDPGAHTFVSKSKNESSLQLNLEAGLSYFILQKVKAVGAKPLTVLELMKEVTGREKLKKCSLIESENIKEGIISSYEYTPESLAPESMTSKEKNKYAIIAVLVIIVGIIFIIWGINDLMRA
jgi:hypothetical protein